MLNMKLLLKYNELESAMTKIHSTTKICAYENARSCNLALDPGK